MYITAATLDDLLHSVFVKLLCRKGIVKASRGDNLEIPGVLLKLRNPRARLSHTERKGTVFSCLGELLWYLAGSRELRFMTYYLGDRYKENSDDKKTVYGAYGPRLYAMDGKYNQLDNVVRVLTEGPTSRRAVIQLFDAKDIQERPKEIPCTCTLQLLLRNHRLEMFASMRSNDAYLGLPHDVFAFTMIQELLARRLGVEPGAYRHFAASMHLYVRDREKARKYVDEGFQPTVNVAMPPMPFGDQGKAVLSVVAAEAKIRTGRLRSEKKLGLHAYWADLIRLLLVFKARKIQDGRAVRALKGRMSTRLYDAYIIRQLRAAAKPPQAAQTTFDFARPEAEKETY